MTNYIDRLSKRMQALNAQFPSLTKDIEKLFIFKNNNNVQWPNYCFLAENFWIGIIEKYGLDKGLNPLDRAKVIFTFETLATWRYTQGIYQFDPTLLDTLINMKPNLDEKIPSDVLLRLPEWCFYIMTPNLTWGIQESYNVYGFWVNLVYCLERKKTFLLLLIDLENISLNLHYGLDSDFTVSDVLAKCPINFVLSDKIKLGEYIYSLFSLLLYLCSNEPEIDNLKKSNQNLKNIWQKSKKNNFKLFPPNKPKIWQIGETIGEQLRQTNIKVRTLSESDSTGRHVKVHVRRPHWHGYWKGSRTEQEKREFIYHWIPPMLVGGYQ